MINNTKLETDIPKGYSIQEDGNTLVITKNLLKASIRIDIVFGAIFFNLFNIYMITPVDWPIDLTILLFFTPL